jgi:hypothetical protein
MARLARGGKSAGRLCSCVAPALPAAGRTAQRSEAQLARGGKMAILSHALRRLAPLKITQPGAARARSAC